MMFRLLASACFIAGFVLTAQAQFDKPFSSNIPNTDIGTQMYRFGPMVVGSEKNPTSLIQAQPKDPGNLRSQISQVQQGEFGSFTRDDRWLGLGPAGNGSAYGLGGSDQQRLMFLNYPTRSNDLILGFGNPADDRPGSAGTSRFVLRNIPTVRSRTKDILIGLPDGAVGINAEPVSTFFVQASEDINQRRFKAIAISGKRLGRSGSSAIGAQGNSFLQTQNVLVEGYRSQTPEFGQRPVNGTATNQQVVNVGRSPIFTTRPAIPFQQYAEITWQDFDYTNKVTTNLNDLTAASAQRIDKMFVSFRNGQANDPFSTANKLPVMTFQANGRVGIGTTQPTSGSVFQPILLDVRGFARVNGTLVGSDRRYKKDIETVENAMEKVNAIRATTYNYDTEKWPEQKFSPAKQYGFIAQELEEVLPEATAQDENGYYAVNYTMLIPVLTAALQEQDDEIEDLTAQLADLADEMQSMRDEMRQLRFGSSEGSGATLDLKQNRPNPFGTVTTIEYTVPENVGSAQLNVYDMTGKLITSYEVARGAGTLDVPAVDYVDGIYLYGLVLDGEQGDLRRMVVRRAAD